MILLEFIFSSFWIFLGTLILLSSVFKGIAGIIHAFKRNPEDEIQTIKHENAEAWWDMKNEIQGLDNDLDLAEYRERVLEVIDSYSPN